MDMLILVITVDILGCLGVIGIILTWDTTRDFFGRR